MPLAAVIIPGPVPGAQAVRTDGAAAPDRMGGAGAFDALLTGGAADDRLRQQLMTGSAPRSDWRVGAMPSPRIVPGGGALPVDGSPGFQDPDMAGTPVKGAPGMSPDSSPGELDPGAPGTPVKGVAGLRPDSSPVEPGAEDPIKLTKGMPGRDLDSSPVEPGEEEPGGPVKGAPTPDSSPVEPDQGEPGIEAKGAPRPVLDSSPVEPGGETPFKPVKDQQGPEVDASPGQIDHEQPGAPVKGAPGLDSSPVMPGTPVPVEAASPAPQAAAPEREVWVSDETETGTDLKAGAQTPAPAPAPEQPVLSNAAPVRREADSRRPALRAEAGKAGDEAVKPAQSGAKAEAPPPAPAAAAAQAGVPDMPAAARSADAFQALLQAQTRPGGEAAPPRAADLALDPSGDTGLRGAPDRAAEVLRTPSMTPPGAPPRFAPQTVQTLAAQIVRRQSEGGRVFDIRLDPPELGRVGVRLEMGKDQLVKAMLSAERPDTLQELQRTARDLERALAEAGLTLAENGLSFSLGGERGERDTPGFETPGDARSVVDIDVARPGAPVTALYGFALARAAGLDIQA